MADDKFSNDSILEIMVTVFIFFCMAAIGIKILFF